MEEYRIKINDKKESKLMAELRKKIKQEVIGQDRAVRRLLRAVASYSCGLKDPRRPIAGFIFAGPTGVGKTFATKVFSRHFSGGKDKYRDYLTRIDGSTLSQEHEVAKLTGSPPGYVGYSEPPVLAQESIDAYHFDVKCGKDDGSLTRKLKEIQKIKASAGISIIPPNFQQQIDPQGVEGRYNKNKPYRSVILFDEIEKAHPKIWNVLLQIMEEGEIQLGKSDKKTSLADSVIVLTTNVGQKDIQEMLRIDKPKTKAQEESLDNRIYEVTKKNVKEKFPPELFKRLDLIVFRPLKNPDFVKILDLFLLEEQERLDERIKQMSRFTIDLEYTPEAKKFLLDEGIDIQYGVRTLRAIVEKHIQAKISNGVTSGEIRPGDKILVDEDKGEIIFFRKPRKRGQNTIVYRKFEEIIEDKPKSEIKKVTSGSKLDH